MRVTLTAGSVAPEAPWWRILIEGGWQVGTITQRTVPTCHYRLRYTGEPEHRWTECESLEAARRIAIEEVQDRGARGRLCVIARAAIE